MNGEYLGHLSRHDRLYGYLQNEIFPMLGCRDCRDGIRVFGTNGSNMVYIYEERSANLKVVGKFFCSCRMPGWSRARDRLRREWENLHLVRSLLGEGHYVARPLGCREDLNCLLVTEYCYGQPFDQVILQAISGNGAETLREKLSALGSFLAELHNHSASGGHVDFSREIEYLESLLNSLTLVITPCERDRIFRTAAAWKDAPEMWEDCPVLNHGDATPGNFFFGDGKYVISFDLERMHRADRVFDVGRMSGELQHFFLRATGNKYLAEPYISHFLREYSSHFPEADAAWRAITRRVPFYMGLTLLRIARNNYLSMEYRHRLTLEAELCFHRERHL